MKLWVKGIPLVKQLVHAPLHYFSEKNKQAITMKGEVFTEME